MPSRALQLTSSQVVRAAWFDEETSTLTVEYKTGGTYTYPGISAADAASFEAAPSPGSWVHKHLKGRG